MKLKAIIFFVFFISLSNHAQNLNANSTGSFIYTPTGVLSNQPIEVFYHIPNGEISTMPIVFSFHGASRNGEDYRDYWVNMANANGFMVFAPEFSDTHYPGLGDNYLMANIFDDGDNPSTSTLNAQEEWTFSNIDPIFNYIKNDINGTQLAYNAWGHSGGAQFLHRFVLYMPNSLLDIAVCSNAGWYTVPENSVSFPYGIWNGELPSDELIAAFSKKIIVHLGEDDNNPNAPGLRRNTVVDNQQGIHRLERGQYFFTKSQEEAQNLNASFTWELHQVEGIGHNAQQMANDALPFILSTTLSSQEFNLNDEFKIYPNPVQNKLFIQHKRLKDFNYTINDIQGRVVLCGRNTYASSTNAIDVSDLATGIYIVKVDGVSKKILKK